MTNIKRYILSFLLCAVLSLSGCVQSGKQSVIKQVTFKTSSQKFGYNYCALSRETPDNGFIMLCSQKTPTRGEKQFYFVKFILKRGKLKQVWEKEAGKYKLDYPSMSIQSTEDGGYLFLGQFISSVNLNIYLMKSDADGNELWNIPIKPKKHHAFRAVSVTEVPDGYLLTGEFSLFDEYLFQSYLVKIDPFGNIVWAETFGAKRNESGTYAYQTYDNGYVMIGHTDSFGAGGSDIYLVKTNFYGKKLWERSYGGKRNESGFHFQETSDGGFILIGSTKSFGAGNKDVYLIKTDKDGNKLWERTYGGKDIDFGTNVRQTADGGYILLGYTDSYGRKNKDIYLIKTDKDGNKLWAKAFPNKHDYLDGFIKETADGGYILLATKSNPSFVTSYVTFIIKTDEDGNLNKGRR